MISSGGGDRPIRKGDDVNDGMPVGILTELGGLGKEANMIWSPQDQYATYPPCQQDESGRYYAGFQDQEGYRNWGCANRIMIDTRIPLEARKPMSLGKVPVLSYQEWMEATKAASPTNPGA